MGQTVVVNQVTEAGEILLIDTDRSFTGQDGMVMSPDDPGEAVPGILAEKLFDLGIGLDHIYVLQNTVTVRRPGGWDEASKASVVSVLESFLLFYTEV
ncbi:MAG TPA: hypothetical protein VFP67_00960 [Acidimicrobiia bacterium]|jgi:hypothetical protein|nr:hypothetical protein [Acidimicrobiia bacterium]